MPIKLLKILGKKWLRKYIILMFGLSLASLLEVLSIITVYPFLKKLISSNENNLNSEYFSIQNLSLVFCLIVTTSALFRIYINKFQGRVGFGIGEEISDRIYKNLIYSDYHDYENMGIDRFVTSILKKSDIIAQQHILPYLNLFVNTLICIGIAIILIYINLVISFYIFLFIGICYSTISLINREKIINSGKLVSRCLSSINQILNITYEGFIENKIYRNEKFFQSKFELLNKELNENLRKIDFLRIYPRFLIESLGVVFLCLMGYYLLLNGERMDVVLPMLGTVAFSAQRMIPSAQQIYYSWSAIKSSKYICEEIIDYLKIKQEDLSEEIYPLQHIEKIHFENVKYKFEGENNSILHNINFRFKKGERIGIIGQSGSGKSTLLRLLIGILNPSSGKITLNQGINLSENKRFLWSRISYISQKMTLFPGTIADNIAPELASIHQSMSRIENAAKSAKISSFVEGLPCKYQTKVGGSSFLPSPGQIQRIILARALYREPEILILDEFTSALDASTEIAIISEILDLFKDKSILMVSHKKSTLNLCDKVYVIKDGNIELLYEK